MNPPPEHHDVDWTSPRDPLVAYGPRRTPSLEDAEGFGRGAGIRPAHKTLEFVLDRTPSDLLAQDVVLRLMAEAKRRLRRHGRTIVTRLDDEPTEGAVLAA